MRTRILIATAVVTLFAFESARVPATATAQTGAKKPAATPLAVLMSATGTVTVVRTDGEEASATFGMQLFSGDEVRTGKGAEAEILFEAGNWLQVGSESKIQIRENRKKPIPMADSPVPDKNFEVVQNFLKLKSADGTSSLTTLRSDNQDNELVAVSPCRTKIRDGRPTFRWEIADPATELKFTLYNEAGVVWEQETKDATSFSYPADAPTLAAGIQYSWTLESTDPLQYPPLRSPAVFFEVLSPEEASMLNEALESISPEEIGSEATYHLMRASILFDQGLVEEAIAETERASQADADNPALQSILARLYVEAGRTADAIEAYNKLRAQ